MTTSSASPKACTYRFGDDTRPGVLLGLSTAQAVPVIGGVLWLSGWLQTGLGVAATSIGLGGLAGGIGVAFGRWRGAPLREIAAPTCQFVIRRILRRERWVRPVLLGTAATPGTAPLPDVMRGLEVLDVPARADGTSGTSVDRVAVVRDQTAGTVTGVIRVEGHGFPFASPPVQDDRITQWAAALAPFAQPGSAVSRVVWQASTCSGSGSTAAPTGETFAASSAPEQATDHDALAADYAALITQQDHLAHDVLMSVTVDLRRVRKRHGTATGTSRLDSGVAVLVDELALFTQRLSTVGVTVSGPLTPVELTSMIRARSDPSRSAQTATLRRSLAAAASKAPMEWGPMVVEPSWGHVRVDAAWHRSFRVAAWPALPVPASWLAPLLTSADAQRTVTVVLEPVELDASARAAGREAMAREADADTRARRGWRVSAKDRKRHREAQAREQELSEGHPEFRYAALVDVTAADQDSLYDAAASIEQTAGQALLDLRPLDARHDLGWLASLPLGRNLTNRGPGL